MSQGVDPYDREEWRLVLACLRYEHLGEDRKPPSMPEIDRIEDIPANFLAYYEIVVSLDSCSRAPAYFSMRI